jgi:phenylalanyl-tRNA synthetase beta chain
VPSGRVSVRQAEYAPWHPGRCAAVCVDDQIVGYAGELHPGVLSALELPKRVCAVEIDLDAVPPREVTQAGRLTTYPAALIDVALVVPADIPAAEVEKALVAGAGSLLESVRLFDVYASEQLGEGMRSLAYKLAFRAPDRTLTVEEALVARDAAVAAAATATGAVLRGA